MLELVPELDPVLELEVASSPELKPVPVLELGLEWLQRRSPDYEICSIRHAAARRRHPILVMEIHQFSSILIGHS